MEALINSSFRLINLSFRRMPESNALIFLDSGIRQNDG